MMLVVKFSESKRNKGDIDAIDNQARYGRPFSTEKLTPHVDYFGKYRA
jgi:hypothetical protein